MLLDSESRKIDYLRISVTDRCNMRCFYCMPEKGVELAAREDILSFEEILRIAKILTSMGVKKIRLTGGEPLVRNGLPYLIRNLRDLKGVEDISLTTNGALLPLYAERLKESGIKRLNISLDTLSEKKFKMITGCHGLGDVLEGISEARKLGFNPLKVNVVVMKAVNDDEIKDFVSFALENGIILRFIEFMRITPLWREDLFVPIDEVKRVCEENFILERLENPGPSPAEHYAVDGKPMLGFIKTDENNCAKCSRLRLTAVGELKICLYEDKGLNLRALMRKNIADDELSAIIRNRTCMKDTVNYRDWENSKTFMYCLGG